ncbi:reverse transcriptase domain-containing protein [Tanacetum coccineum]
MAKEDEEKTAFITSQGIFCYTKMPFGLRNAGATYQRLVDKAFHKQIGRNLEVYVDDLVIKSRTEDEIVSTRRLKVCPDKVDAVLSLPSPRCLKDVQRLNGKLASLNRFLAKSAEKSLPFFKTLKKCTRKSDFYWTTEAEEAFKQMKQLIAELPMLVAPMEKEELIITPRVFRLRIKSLASFFVPLPCYSLSLLDTQVSNEGQILADFIVERLEEESPDTLIGEEEELLELWILFTDGSSCTDGSGAGLILINPEGMKFTYALRFSAGGGTKRKVDKYGGSLAVVEEEGDTWMSLIFKYLMDGTLPIRSEITRAVKRKSWRRKKADKGMPRLPNSQACPKESSAKAKPNQRLRVQSKSGFTKLMKQATVATITGKQIKKFIWDNIVCRFGLPGEIISNNGKQFQDNLFKDWCEKLCIRQHFASVKHIQTNGLVERANRSLGEGIKARLDERSKNWMEELPMSYWAHRTRIKSSNIRHPILVNIMERKVVIPAEIGMPTLRTAEVDLVQNNEALENQP